MKTKKEKEYTYIAKVVEYCPKCRGKVTMIRKLTREGIYEYECQECGWKI